MSGDPQGNTTVRYAILAELPAHSSHGVQMNNRLKNATGRRTIGHSAIRDSGYTTRRWSIFVPRSAMTLPSATANCTAATNFMPSPAPLWHRPILVLRHDTQHKFGLQIMRLMWSST
jgi:hypothetical protein